ncbi:probable serine hydrolase [Musca autumnalis]|uniref:probable serine hydrolase n=1 Tax=Musca autumnalis TaxID=221902 RepID=UPI003CF3270F
MSTSCLDFEDVRIPVPWGHISGRWYGNRNVRPILALHGWQDNLGTWTPLLPLLPKHISFLCIDFPGHGHSSRLPKGIIYNVIDYVLIVGRIMKVYKWEKVSLMGHSLGGIVAYTYASLLPDTVDLLIQIDIIKTPYRSPDETLKRYEIQAEKLLIADERYDDTKEPPVYTLEELEEVLHRGSGNSIDKDKCKYLIERGCAMSQRQPDKLYISRDPKVKFYTEFVLHNSYIEDFAKRTTNINHLVIRGTKSPYLKDSFELVDNMKKFNPNFRFYEVEGSHHIHLNKPDELANIIGPFISDCRPENEIKETRSKL